MDVDIGLVFVVGVLLGFLIAGTMFAYSFWKYTKTVSKNIADYEALKVQVEKSMEERR